MAGNCEDESRVAQLVSCLKESRNELLETQRRNFELVNEVRNLKEIYQREKEKLDSEKKKHEAVIARLGFKMLHFENELRKEERGIERRFIEKDQKIKMLQDVINSLQASLKTNTLCHNCFMTKHSAIVAEHGVNQENFIAKFPLELDYEDHKSPGHDSRGRSLSLPLNLTNQQESIKSNVDFCYHHDLSPVPEELESSFLDHARKINQQPTIIEEEEDLVAEPPMLNEEDESKKLLTNPTVQIKSADTESKYEKSVSDCRMTIEAISLGIKSFFDEQKIEEADKEVDVGGVRITDNNSNVEETEKSNRQQNALKDEKYEMDNQQINGSDKVKEITEEEDSNPLTSLMAKDPTGGSCDVLNENDIPSKTQHENLTLVSEMLLNELVDAVVNKASVVVNGKQQMSTDDGKIKSNSISKYHSVSSTDKIEKNGEDEKGCKLLQDESNANQIQLDCQKSDNYSDSSDYDVIEME